MKLLKKNDKEESTKALSIQEGTDFVGLQAFEEKYPNSATTPLVYFEDGMVPVQSPFTSIVGLSKMIAETDPGLVSRMIEKGHHMQLEEFMVARKNGILTQFNARCNFLSRALMMNLEQRIYGVINEMCGNMYIHSIVRETTMLLANGFHDAVANPTFGDSTDQYIDFVTTYAYNTTTIPRLVAQIYDMYDEIIVESVGHHVSRKQTAEEVHMDVLNGIMPAFELLKSQMEWLFYMLRSEAENIYRPMAMIPAEKILDEIYSKEIQYRHPIIEALDAGDFDRAKMLLDRANAEGIDTGIEMTTFDYRSDEEKKEDGVEQFQDMMIEAAKENPEIKTTIF